MFTYNHVLNYIELLYYFHYCLITPLFYWHFCKKIGVIKCNWPKIKCKKDSEVAHILNKLFLCLDVKLSIVNVSGSGLFCSIFADWSAEKHIFFCYHLNLLGYSQVEEKIKPIRSTYSLGSVSTQIQLLDTVHHRRYICWVLRCSRVLNDEHLHCLIYEVFCNLGT